MNEKLLGTERFFHLDPLQGYQAHKDFPDCCAYHRKIGQELEKGKEYYSWRLSTLKGRKMPFDRFKFRMLKHLSFTEHHTTNTIGHHYWYEDITDYIYYNTVNLISIKGSRFHLQWTKYFIQKATELSAQKQQRLIAFIDWLLKPAGEMAKDTEINLQTYLKWSKTFPSDITYVDQIRQQGYLLKNIFFKETRFNPYLGEEFSELKTNPEVIAALVEATRQMLKKVTTAKLLEDGSISKKEKIQVIASSR